MMDEGIVEFRQSFIERGWRGIERDFGSSTAVNRKLIERAGGQELLAARAARNRSRNTGRTGWKAGSRG